jgi:DnaJ-class molecular chaperone
MNPPGFQNVKCWQCKGLGLVAVMTLRGRRWMFCPRCRGAGAVLVPISARFHDDRDTVLL